MSVGRICVRQVDTATLEEPVRVAAERMHQRAVGTLVVVSSDGKPIGILTDRDVTVRIVAEGLNSYETPVSMAMTPSPKTIVEDTPIETALALMRSGRFRRLPVVDHSNTLVGLVTLDDILMLLAEEFTDVGKLLKTETPSGVAVGV